MDYTISKADGTTLLSVLEGQTSASAGYSVTFVGKNFPAYGSYINNNFLRLLENSAKTTAPAVPVKGQIWYDSTNNLVKVYNGTAWLTVGPNASTAITVKDDGTNLTTALASIDFVGAGVTATNSSGAITVTIPGGGGSALTVKDDGTNLSTAVTSIDFAGAGVTATNSSGAITVTIPGGGGGGSYTLPTASSSTLGGVKVDATSITINSSTGVISAGTLDSLSDVVITTPTANQVLSYNSATSQWVNGAVNLGNNADIVDLKKKLFLLEKFGSVAPGIVFPPEFDLVVDNVGYFNVLSIDAFVPRNTWSNRIYTWPVGGSATSVPSLQSFSNTSGFDIYIVVRVRVKTSADDDTKYQFLTNGVVADGPVIYSGGSEQRRQEFTYNYGYTVLNGETRTFEIQGWVTGVNGQNGRGYDTIGAKMVIAFDGWI
jgi:hypothetical protein